MQGSLVVYVDVDDTLIRTVGSKRIPVSHVTEHVRILAKAGAELYCWSSGGAAYARLVAVELGIEELFASFLPKPQVLIDDMAVSDWRRMIEVHPGECPRWTEEAYRQAVS